MVETRTLSRDNYTVGWICALPTEMKASRAMMDELHSPPAGIPTSDENFYVFGSIGGHDIAMTCLPGYGVVSAATSSKSMQSTFRNLRVGLMVGIGGGIPGVSNDIRLGDVVVSLPDGTGSGVVQYDMGKMENNEFVRVGSLNKPPISLLAVIQGGMRIENIPVVLPKLIEEARKQKIEQEPGDNDEIDPWEYPGAKRDILFKADFSHIGGHPTCDACAAKETFIVERSPRKSTPVVHYGNIASGNVVMKNALRRDELAKKENVICFEMEAAGLTDSFPCLVIRGICDYCDSHKNKTWQPYAATVAAAYAKKLLMVMPPRVVEKLEPFSKQMEDNIRILCEVASKQEEKRIREENKAIEQWLSPKLEFLNVQNELIKRCYPTGKRFLESEEFLGWVEGRSWPLRCYGETGTGKTYLSSIVVDYLQREYQTEETPVLCIYLSEVQTEYQTPAALFGSLLKQLVQLKGSKPVAPELREKYREGDERGTYLGLPELKELLSSELKKYRRVFLVVDALDEESPDPKFEIEKFFSELSPKNPLSLMITSTTESDWRCSDIYCSAEECETPDKKLQIYLHCEVCNKGDFDICQTCKNQGKTCLDPRHILTEPYNRVEVEYRGATDEEIEAYVAFVINEKAPQEVDKVHRDSRVHPESLERSTLARKLKEAPELRQRISSEIIRKAEGKFILATLYMDSLIQARTLEQLKNRLDDFPDGWNKLYEQRMTERVKSQTSEDFGVASKTLSINTFAHRALTWKELQHALSVTPGEKCFNREGKIDREYILEVTKGFLTIDNGDAANSFVRFFHLTVQRYLEESKDRWFPEAEAEMARICLTRIQYEMYTNDDLQHAEPDIESNPFAEYAFQFWGDHVREAISNKDIEKMALEFLRDSGRVEAFIEAAWFILGEGSESWGSRQGIAGIHVCAWFGLSTLILNLAVENHNIDAQETSNGQTPLIYACRRGHIEAARQLMKLGANVNVITDEGKTALWEAIRSKRVDMVDLLLDNDTLDINTVDSKGRTALILAILCNLEDIAETLAIRSDIDANLRDHQGYTALALAVEEGFIGVVEALLAKPGTDVNLIYAGGRSALIIAAELTTRNEIDMVLMLLQNGADPNLKDKYRGGSALSAAIERNHRDIVRELLQFEQTDPLCVDYRGQGLMHYAARYGECDILRQLSQRKLDVNLKDGNGFSPLHEAAARCHLPQAVEVVELLLEMGAERGMTDGFGKTPGDLAADCGNANITTLLGGQIAEVVPPIWLMVKLGQIHTLKEAISAGKMNLDQKEPGTRNGPLHHAILGDHVELLRLLLESGKMDPDSRGELNWAPLHLAAMRDQGDAATMLLKHNADINSRDSLNYTPLLRAEHNYHFDLAVTLIEAGACVDARSSVQRLFFAAVKNDRLEAVKILLGKGANPMTRNEHGLVAHQLAKKGRGLEMMSLLDSAKTPLAKRGQISANPAKSTSSKGWWRSLNRTRGT